MTPLSPDATILKIPVNPDERALLEAAAEQAGASLSEFVRHMAVEAAETEILSRSVVVIPAQDWEAFESWLDRPAETIPQLEELARRTPSWER